MARQNLTEAGAGIVTATESSGKKPTLQVQLITPGWGSSGYYSAAVLEAAAKAGAWPAGTQMYLNHSTDEEREQRPGRSVKDLAAKLTEAARWNGSAVVANAVPIGAGHQYVTDKEFLDAVGVSITASAEVELGEAEGRNGWIVQEIFADEFNSADFVTHAGRGGRVLSLIESARRSTFTLNETSAEDTERAIQDAVSQAYSDSAKETYSWLKDYDPDQKLAYFELSVAGVCTTYQQTYEVRASGDIELAGDKTEVTQRTSYVPVNAAESATPPIVPRLAPGQPTTTRENTMPENEGAKTSVEESQRRELEEKAGRVDIAEAKLVKETERANLAEHKLAVSEAREYARDFGVKRVKDANGELPSAVVEKIVAEAMREIPLTEAEKAADRRLDTEAFGKKVDEARTAEETYLASIVENGAGRVRGVGSTEGKAEVTEAQANNIIAGAFGRTVKGA